VFIDRTYLLNSLAIVLTLGIFQPNPINDTLVLSCRCIQLPCQEHEKLIKNHLNTSPNANVLLHAERFDSILFKSINRYRNANGLNVFQISERLDSLAWKVNFWNQHHSTLTHYSAIPEMKPYCDLLNGENIWHTYVLNKAELISPAQIMNSWVKSPSHNQNLLIPKLCCAAVSTLVKFSNDNGNPIVEIYSTFETDSEISKRQLTEQFDAANQKIWNNLKKRKSNE
jgi:hypothetical protein